MQMKSRLSWAVIHDFGVEDLVLVIHLHGAVGNPMLSCLETIVSVGAVR